MYLGMYLTDNKDLPNLAVVRFFNAQVCTYETAPPTST